MNRFPSRRPKVSEVSKWHTVYTDEITNDRRGLYGGTVVVEVADEFPDYYKVTTWLGQPTVKKVKYFYGEMAVYGTRRYVADAGFNNIYLSNMY